MEKKCLFVKVQEMLIQLESESLNFQLCHSRLCPAALLPAHTLWTLANCSHYCGNWHCTYLITPHFSRSREPSPSIPGFSAAPKRDASEN